MRILLQRVKHATVYVYKNECSKTSSSISKGLVAFIGFQKHDNEETCRWAYSQISTIRVFSDTRGRLKYALHGSEHGLMLIPSVTLSLTPRKHSMNFEDAMDFSTAKKLFSLLCTVCREWLAVKAGTFGSHMEIASLVDGPINVFQSRQESPT